MKPIATAVDYYTPITSLEKVSALKTSGVSSFIRYLGFKTRGYTKAMTQVEAKLLLTVRAKIVSVWEGEPNAVREGHAQGLQDGKDALEDAKWLGQPEGSAIYFAVDYDAQAKDDATIQAYFTGVRESLGSAYKVGAYGGAHVVKMLQWSSEPPDYFWQTVAWSANQIITGIHMFQKLVDTKRAGIKVDVSDVYQSPGWWPLDVVKPAVPKVTTMQVFVQSVPIQAIVVDNETYVLWSALGVLKTPYTKLDDHGLFLIDGQQVRGFVYNGEAYLPWASLAKGIKSQKVWSFTK